MAREDFLLMNDAENVRGGFLSSGVRAGVWALGCVMIGGASALVVWYDARLSIGILCCLALAAAGTFVLGLPGLILLLTSVMSFLLMQRLDEGLAIPFYDVSLRGMYWMTPLLLALLVAHVLWYRLELRSPAAEERRLAGRLFARWTWFTIFALAALALNHLMDDRVVARKAPGELLGVLAICLPVLFCVLILLSDLSPRRTLLCIQALIGLGGFAGFIMALFGLLPDQVVGMLGWVKASGGTVDLVRGRLPLGHPNAVAATMLLLLPAATVLGLSRRVRLWRVFYLSCAVLMFAGVLFSLSRASLFNMGLVLCVTLGYLFFTERDHRLRGCLVSLFLAAFLMLLAAGLLSRYDFSRFWSRGYYEAASVARRADSMRSARIVWKDHMLWGASPDAVYPRLELRPGWTPPVSDSISPIIFYRGHRSSETPHNFYLTLLAEFGLLGGILFLSMVIAVGRALWRIRSLPKLDADDRKTIDAFALGLGAFLVAGMSEAVLMVGLRVSLVAWIFAGLALRYALLAAEKDTAPPAQSVAPSEIAS